MTNVYSVTEEYLKELKDSAREGEYYMALFGSAAQKLYMDRSSTRRVLNDLSCKLLNSIYRKNQEAKGEDGELISIQGILFNDLATILHSKEDLKKVCDYIVELRQADKERRSNG